MTEPLITVTVLNPGDHDGPWDVELVLTGPDGAVAGRESITHGAAGCDWDEVAGPALLRLRGVAEARGWSDASAGPEGDPQRV